MIKGTIIFAIGATIGIINHFLNYKLYTAEFISIILQGIGIGIIISEYIINSGGEL